MIVFSTFLAIAGSISCGVLFNLKLKRWPFAGMVGGLGFLVYTYMYAISKGQIVSLFCASLALGLLSEFLAIALKTPSIVFSIVGVIPILPGYAAYSAIKLILDKNLMEGSLKGLYALSSVASILCGVLLATSLMRLGKLFGLRCKDILHNRQRKANELRPLQKPFLEEFLYSEKERCQEQENNKHGGAHKNFIKSNF